LTEDLHKGDNIPIGGKMSKLIEKLQLISAAAEPMGFRAALTVPKRQSMLLVASLPCGDAEAAACAQDSADAVLVSIGDLKAEAKALKQMASAWAGIPWGAWLETATGDGIRQLQAMGCDFIVFDAARTAASALPEAEIGRVLKIDPSLADGLVRTIDQLPVDGALLSPGSESPFLSVHLLMICQRLASMVRKPLVVATPSAVTDSDVESLWQAGVDGVVVSLETQGQRAKLLELRQAIDGLPPPAKHRGELEALLPCVGEAGAELEEEEI
jgi:hypothetical protein